MSYCKNPEAPDHTELTYGDSLLGFRYYRSKYQTTFRFRCDPVPGTRKPKNGRWLRHPKTTQEHREIAKYNFAHKNLELLEDFGPKPRRSKKYLVTVYDDIQIRPKNGWKNHRKTQYRLKTVAE